MKTRIATSLGIALVLVFGIVGVLVAFGPQEAQADHSPPRNPHPPTAIKAEATPNDPNTVAKWTIEFINGQVATQTRICWRAELAMTSSSSSSRMMSSSPIPSTAATLR